MIYPLEDKAIPIRDFAIANGLQIEVLTRDPKTTEPGAVYYAHLKDVSIREGSCERSTFGNGHDPEEAIDNMAAEYSEVRLKIRDRGVFKTPKLKACAQTPWPLLLIPSQRPSQDQPKR